MSELMKKYGGLILFYGIIILGVLMLNERFRYLNNLPNLEQTNIEIEMAFYFEGGEKDV